MTSGTPNSGAEVEAETGPSARGGTPNEPAEAAGTWEELFRLGDTLAVSDTQESSTLTAAVLAMRR